MFFNRFSGKEEASATLIAATMQDAREFAVGKYRTTAKARNERFGHHALNEIAVFGKWHSVRFKWLPRFNVVVGSVPPGITNDIGFGSLGVSDKNIL